MRKGYKILFRPASWIVSIYIMEDNSNADAAGGVKDDIVECLHQFEILRWR